ncbi:MAG TPA: tandem-95 repeat protein, partial [Candidatus Thioglobus sp.]|nr:tandem-95 repeat protein [Candidatus Thioglobus sp.]
TLTSGQVYTWHIYFSGSQTTGWISFANNNPYSGGYGYYCCDDVTDDDFQFKIQGDDEFNWTYNIPPIILSINDLTINEDETGTVTLSATDVDGNALTYTGKSNTDKVTISISSATMTLTPAADWYGTASITAYVSDGTVKDSTTFTLSVTPVNDAPIMTFFTPNTSLNFDGTDDYVDLGVISSTNFTNADFSIQTWVKTTSSKAQSILVKGDGDGAWEAGEKALYMEAAGYPWFVGYDNEYIPGTGLTINDGLWHHIVVTWDYSEGETGSAAIYVDGVKATVETSYRARTVDKSTDKLYLGKAEAWEAQNDFDGNIDEVGIWDKALSDVEVAALYNASSGLNAAINSGNYTSSSNLQGYWRMYEGTGNIINDLSTNNNSGTISGATWDKNTGIGSTNVVTNEETATKIALSASDIDGDALTYTASADTNAVTLTVLTDTLQLTPALNYTGTSVITVIVSDNALTDTTKFDFTVINVNDAPVIAAVANDTTSEDSDGKALRLSASDIDGDGLTYSAFSDTLGLTVTVSNDTVRLKPVTDYFGTSKVTAIVNDGAINDSTTFSFTVLNVQDAPYAFDWVSTASDTIDISQSNLTDTYELKWSESKDVDGETIDYLLYVKIGVLEPDEIYDTTSTSIPITYQEFVENVFEPFPMLPRVTVQFSMEATDGIDTVKITGGNRVLFVNRYEYLSTVSDGIPTEFALHENYPNPFNPTTTLRFDLPDLSDMTLTIYNMLGQKVKTFSMQSIPAGYHSVTWDATNDLGVGVGAGVYLYQLQTKDFVKTRKMVLLK